MRLAFLIAAGSFSLAAQTYTLGTTADPCTGGTPYTIQATGATLRYGDFTCTFSVPADGMYQVVLSMVEPCIGECNPPVTAAGQRIQNVFINDTPALWSLDPFAAGSTAPGTAVTRTVAAYAAGKQIVVRMQTVKRSAVLSAVTLSGGAAMGGGPPSKIGMTAGPAPGNTVMDGVTYSAVMFVDQADGQFKVLLLNGSTLVMMQATPSAPAQ